MRFKATARDSAGQHVGTVLIDDAKDRIDAMREGRDWFRRALRRNFRLRVARIVVEAL